MPSTTSRAQRRRAGERGEDLRRAADSRTGRAPCGCAAGRARGAGRPAACPTSARRPRRAAPRASRARARASRRRAACRARRSRRRRSAPPRSGAGCPPRCAAASSTRRASRVTSGPIPSPGRTRMRCTLRSPSAPATECRRLCHSSLFSACTYARALATMMSGSAPLPITRRPSSHTVTDTSPSASMPPVIAFTWKRSSSLLVSVSSAIALNTASTGPIPSAVALTRLPCRPELDGGGGLGERAREHGHLLHREALVGAHDRVGGDRLEVLVEDRLLRVREVLEAPERLLERLALELEAELGEPLAERVAARSACRAPARSTRARSTAAS